jgi:hypothetical protein
LLERGVKPYEVSIYEKHCFYVQASGCRSTSLTGKLQKFQECNNMDEEPEFVEFSQ